MRAGPQIKDSQVCSGVSGSQKDVGRLQSKRTSPNTLLQHTGTHQIHAPSCTSSPPSRPRAQLVSPLASSTFPSLKFEPVQGRIRLPGPEPKLARSACHWDIIGRRDAVEFGPRRVFLLLGQYHQLQACIYRCIRLTARIRATTETWISRQRFAFSPFDRGLCPDLCLPLLSPRPSSLHASLLHILSIFPLLVVNLFQSPTPSCGCPSDDRTAQTSTASSSLSPRSQRRPVYSHLPAFGASPHVGSSYTGRTPWVTFLCLSTSRGLARASILRTTQDRTSAGLAVFFSFAPFQQKTVHLWSLVLLPAAGLAGYIEADLPGAFY